MRLTFILIAYYQWVLRTIAFIPHGEYLQISYIEMTRSRLLWISCLVLTSIDVNMNQSIRKIFRGEGDIRIGKVDL